LQAKRETNDDRQREFEERLQKHQAEMAQAREALAVAEAQLSTCQEEREGMRTAIQNKDEEVKQLSRG
jgi:chromosome segregation ATPase